MTLGPGSDNPRGKGLYDYCVGMLVLSTMAVTLRLWSRMVNHVGRGSRQSRFWWDDWFALMNLPVIITGLSMEMRWTTLGLGKHASDIPQSNLVQGLKLLYGIELIYNIAISLAKTSAIFFYPRIFQVRTNTTLFNVTLWTTHVLVVAWAVGTVFSAIFQCTPIKMAWDPSLNGRCLALASWWLASAISSLIIDLIILVIPLPMLWRLRLTVSRKILVTGVFLSGYAVITVSIGRLIAVGRAQKHLTNDLTYYAVPTNYWHSIEAPISLLAVCLPAIYNLIKRGIQHGPCSLLTSKNFPTPSSSSSGGRSWPRRPTRSNYRGVTTERRGEEDTSEDHRPLDDVERLGSSASVLPAPSKRGNDRLNKEENYKMQAIRVTTDIEIENKSNMERR